MSIKRHSQHASKGECLCTFNDWRFSRYNVEIIIKQMIGYVQTELNLTFYLRITITTKNISVDSEKILSNRFPVPSIRDEAEWCKTQFCNNQYQIKSTNYTNFQNLHTDYVTNFNKIFEIIYKPKLLGFPYKIIKRLKKKQSTTFTAKSQIDSTVRLNYSNKGEISYNGHKKIIQKQIASVHGKNVTT